MPGLTKYGYTFSKQWNQRKQGCKPLSGDIDGQYMGLRSISRALFGALDIEVIIMEKSVVTSRTPLVLRARWRGTLLASLSVAVVYLIFSFCARPFAPWASGALYLFIALAFFGGALSMMDTLGSYRRARDFADTTDRENEVSPK